MHAGAIKFLRVLAFAFTRRRSSSRVVRQSASSASAAAFFLLHVRPSPLAPRLTPLVEKAAFTGENETALASPRAHSNRPPLAPHRTTVLHHRLLAVRTYAEPNRIENRIEYRLDRTYDR